MLLGALKNKAIDKRSDLTEAEENEIVLKEIKQLKETLDSAPVNRTDIIDQCNFRIQVYEEFAPKFMTDEEIRATIRQVLDKLELTAPTAKDKGKIMKELMPLVKGKSDGKVVNALVSEFFK